jgi:predicted metal-dependent enzyme (double-stranded beta helix superfamily)
LAAVGSENIQIVRPSRPHDPDPEKTVPHSAELSADVRTLIKRLDRAVSLVQPETICEEVKASLIQLAVSIPADFLKPAPERYARRLLHRCPDGSYSVMVMVWAPGQGTPIHDHAGKWCVECVIEGQIEITKYNPTSDTSAETVRFEEVETEIASPGEVGILFPPNEYHRIRNVSDTKAITVHVYAGEMLWCHAFHPIESGEHKKERCDLSYTG